MGRPLASNLRLQNKSRNRDSLRVWCALALFESSEPRASVAPGETPNSGVFHIFRASKACVACGTVGRAAPACGGPVALAVIGVTEKRSALNAQPRQNHAEKGDINAQFDIKNGHGESLDRAEPGRGDDAGGINHQRRERQSGRRRGACRTVHKIGSMDAGRPTRRSNRHQPGGLFQ